MATTMGRSYSREWAPPTSLSLSREGPKAVLSPIAIVGAWALSVDEYAAAGHDVVVPRPDCPGCATAMAFWSG